MASRSTVGCEMADVTVPVLAVEGLSKSYPGTRALDRVTLSVLPGEVHALMGENGAGKTTLLMVLSGVVSPDEGQVTVNGTAVEFDSPRDAHMAGVGTVFQELSLVGALTVAENILVNRDHGGRAGVIQRKKMDAEAAALLGLLDSHISPRARVRDLGVGDQQLVEIAKALAADAQLLLLDEPTSALSQNEIASLLAVVRRLTSQGIGIIFVSHRIAEVYRFADRISVLRDGHLVGTYQRDSIEPAAAVRLMIGRELSALFPPRSAEIGQVVLEARGVYAGRIGPVDLEIRAGEIVGLAGLQGAGRSQLARALTGASRVRHGEILLDGERMAFRGPWEALRHRIAYLAPDRKEDGSFLRMTVADNLTVTILRKVSRGGMVRAVEQYRTAWDLIHRYDVRTRGPQQLMGDLSGGNQQKILLARCLTVGPRILVLDEPTQGIDVGAKADVYGLIRDLAESGVGILLISSELPEILGMSDRVVVMAGGTVRANLSTIDVTEEQVISYAIGKGAT